MILREPERVTLVDALRLLEGHLPAEEARSRLRQAFTQKVIQQQPLFALEYDGADIDWTTGAVKIPRKRERFYPTFSRADITNYFFAFHKDCREIKDSDGIDLIHAMYLPHADLWRGDKAFSTLLINNRVRFCNRIVPSLAELPGRIEAAIARPASESRFGVPVAAANKRRGV